MAGSITNSSVKAIYKVVVIGENHVGKTCLVERFVSNTFPLSPPVPTTVYFHNKSVLLGSSTVNLNIWDTGGVQRLRPIISAYVRDARAALVVYDVTSRASFEQVTFWMRLIKEEVKDNIFIILVGNKTDLHAQRSVAVAEGEAMAKEENVEFTETSANTNVNVIELFAKVAEKIQSLPPSRIIQSVTTNEEDKRRCGCILN